MMSVYNLKAVEAQLGWIEFLRINFILMVLTPTLSGVECTLSGVDRILRAGVRNHLF